MAFLPIIFILSSLLKFSNAQRVDRIGINYGKQGSNLPTPYQSIDTIANMKAGMVRLYDTDSETLRLVAGTSLHVVITVSNDDIVDLARKESLASKWVHDNIFAYYPRTMIRYIMVGNEVYSNRVVVPDQWDNLVLAMTHIMKVLKSHEIHNIKVGTPLGMDILSATFPPSNGTFKVDTLTTMVPLLQLLHRSNSYFCLNVYPYFPWSKDTTHMNLNFTLFEGGNLTYKDPYSGLVYNNVLDQMLDSVYSAMSKIGFPNVPIAISETGWPSKGDLDQPGANVYNAATYNRNLIKKIVAEPPLGTPARPGTIIPAFLFSLYDENLKDGPETERHWGLVKPNGTPVYQIDLTGTQTEFDPLPNATNNMPYKGEVWCVVQRSANMTELGSMVTNLCSRLNGTCEAAIGPGNDCYQPVSILWHASYTFSAYWAQFRRHGTYCQF
uniref:glucan endo-1,3-beta-D-glucosidase n=1 Tax=Silene latifolia TaxID=37657 RepID=Q2ACE6_SILLA|nr:glycosyl hydrolase family 17 [Silene latifolia]